MHLVKWLRKNNMKVMAVVIIGLMVAFVGGSYLQQLGQRRRTGGLKKAVAYYGDNQKVTAYDLNLARRELQVLRMLRVNLLLGGTRDLYGILLRELLFSQPAASSQFIRHIRQATRMAGVGISDRQLNDIYRRAMPASIYWLLLKKEAEQAGIRMSNEMARSTLERLIPQIAAGATYSEVVQPIVDRQGVPEKEVLGTFGRLLTVLRYSRMICSNEDITVRQVMQTVSRQEEGIDIEFVKFDSAVFADGEKEPTEQAILEHFEKYRKFYAGRIGEENPYGFGYKLPDRVRLEYIGVRLDDVSEIVEVPTQEQTEQYYQRFRAQYTEQVPSDPNDPNSPLTTLTRSYAEVADAIFKGILRSRMVFKANSILQQAKELTEAGLTEIETDSGEVTAERFREMAGDYEAAAKQLSKEHKVEVYAGRTGLLSAEVMQGNEYLGRMYVDGYGHNPPEFLNLVRLPKVIFAMDQLGAGELGPFDTPKPKMYENIGPFKDVSGQVMMLVRVIEIQTASEPEGIDYTYSRKVFSFDAAEGQTDEDIYSVREEVAEDLKRLSAMGTASSRAEEFIKQAAKDGWQETVEKFNKLYGPQDGAEDGQGRSGDAVEGGGEAFKLESLTNLRRLPRRTLEMLVVQSEGDPAGKLFIETLKKERLLMNQLFSLVPQQAETIDTLPLVMEFRPDMSYYCLKELSVKRLDEAGYEQIKAERAYQVDLAQTESLAAVHFNPQNILKRMDFKLVPTEQQAADVNEPAGPG